MLLQRGGGGAGGPSVHAWPASRAVAPPCQPTPLTLVPCAGTAVVGCCGRGLHGIEGGRAVEFDPSSTRGVAASGGGAAARQLRVSAPLSLPHAGPPLPLPRPPAPALMWLLLCVALRPPAVLLGRMPGCQVRAFSAAQPPPGEASAECPFCAALSPLRCGRPAVHAPMLRSAAQLWAGAHGLLRRLAQSPPAFAPGLPPPRAPPLQAAGRARRAAVPGWAWHPPLTWRGAAAQGRRRQPPPSACCCLRTPPPATTCWTAWTACTPPSPAYWSQARGGGGAALLFGQSGGGYGVGVGLGGGPAGASGCWQQAATGCLNQAGRPVEQQIPQRPRFLPCCALQAASPLACPASSPPTRCHRQRRAARGPAQQLARQPTASRS
jgi:hypothetical protein